MSAEVKSDANGTAHAEKRPISDEAGAATAPESKKVKKDDVELTDQEKQVIQQIEVGSTSTFKSLFYFVELEG